ncbi:MAG: hypothetical protein FD122_3770, partial [Stygiobacter sp.]
MKKITAYINTIRVHWLVEELESIGINEMMVTEYFSPSSKISRMELLAQDDAVEKVREIIHRIGTTGEVADHSLFVDEYDPKLPSQIPLGQRTSKLEETRVKQLINFLLHGSHRKIRSAFLLITLGIIGVAVFIEFQTNNIRYVAAETLRNTELLSEANSAMKSALLEEMLAAERFHRGETTAAREDFRNARRKLNAVLLTLKEANTVTRAMVDSLTNLEHKF